MDNITGRVLNWNNYEPIPFATVELYSGSNRLAAGSAGADGRFSISAGTTPEFLRVSSVGYLTRDFGFAEFQYFDYFFLKQDEKTLEDLPIYSTIPKKTSWIAIGLIALLLLMNKKRK
jgi:hypothetical protein